MPDSKNVTLRDVAKMAGVSIATVSRALNDTSYVSPEVRKNIMDAIEELGYYQNTIARSLKTHSTFTIAFVTADISNPYMITVARMIEEVVLRQKYALIMCSTKGSPELEAEYLQMLMGRKIDALILNGTGYNEDFVVKISKRIPVILLHRRYTDSRFRGDYFDSDNKRGIKLLTQHLLSFGHRNIFVIKGDTKATTNIDRFQSFKSAMLEAGILVDEHYPWQYGKDFTTETGYSAVEYLRGMSEKPTALLAFNNTLALGALQGIISYNVRVPEDLSVASFNTISNRELMFIRPTVYNIDPAEIGAHIGTALLERLEDSSLPYREFSFTGELIPGNAVSFPSPGRKTDPYEWTQSVPGSQLN